MVQAVATRRRPRARQLRQPKDRPVEIGGSLSGTQVLTVRQPQRRADDPSHVVRMPVQPSSAALQFVGKPLQAAGQVAVDLESGPPCPAGDLHVSGVPVGALADHLVFDLRGDHRTGAAEILPYVVDLTGGDLKKRQLVLQGTIGEIGVLPAGGNEVVNLDHRRRLTVPVNRPLRCSNLLGFHGISQCSTRWQ
jgi:hypothetical protein